MTNSPLHIRPARAADRAAVVEMVATVWDGGDYLPKVWDDWLADAGGPLLIGELDGRPAAVAKLSALGPGEDWFEGLRVAPEQRGRGFARAVLQRCVDLSRERGARVLRYMTAEENTPMHRIGDDLGFQLIYAPMWYKASPRAGAPAAAVVPAERCEELLRDLAASPLLARTGGLYTYDWCTFELTEQRLRAHIERGEVQALDGGAWAIVIPNERGGAWLAHVEGQGSDLERLCLAIRAGMGPGDDAYARALLPMDAPHIRAIQAAGFADEGHQMRVYELRM